MQTGRNDPCPCGSGRKYKRCCGTGSVLDAAARADRIRELQQALEPKLVRWARLRLGEGALGPAMEEFAQGREGVDPAGAEVQVFEPWLLYEWRPRIGDHQGGASHPRGRELREDGTPGVTIAEAFLEDRPERSDARERDFVQAVTRGCFSFHEVAECSPGRRLRLRDVLRGIEQDVIERSGSAALRPGDILYARVVPFDDFALMIGCGSVPLPPAEMIGLIDLRESIRSRLGRITAGLIREISPELRSRYLDLAHRVMNPPPLELCNTDGDALRFHRLTYRVDSTQEAFHALKPLARGVAEVDLLSGAKYDARGRLREVEVPLLKPVGTRVGPGGNTILGRLLISGRKVQVEVNSDRRARRLRAEIEKRLGEGATFLREEIESMESLQERAARAARTPAGKRRREEDEAFRNRPEILAATREFLAAHWEGWPEESVPALGGLTPAEAMKTPDGREKVEALLADFERKAERAGPEGEIQDIGRLRKRLGLTGRRKKRSARRGRNTQLRLV